MKVKEVGFTEFCDLVEYLSKLELNTSNDEERIFATIKKLYGFFPKLSSNEILPLNELVTSIILKKDDSEQLFNKFILNYADLEFDNSGMAKPKIEYNNWERISVDMVFEEAKKQLSNGKDKSKGKAYEQVINAFSLTCLKNIKESNYQLKKVQYLKFVKYDFLNKDEIKDLENKLEWLVGRKQMEKIMSKLLEFLLNKKKYENANIFVSNFISRVSLVYSDTKKEFSDTEEFINNLKQL